MKKIILGFSALAVVAGCGGSGGSGGSSPSSPSQPSVTQFSSFDDLPENGTVSVPGMALTATYTYDAATNELTLVDGVSSFDDAEVIARLENGEATRLSFNNTGNDVTFGDDADFIDDGDAVFLINGEMEDIAILVVGSDGEDFSYQNYGAWLTGYNTGSGAASVGSFGARTSVDQMPDSGSATYTGGTAGFVVENDDYYLAESDFAAVADFDESTIAVASSNTWLTEIESGSEINASDLDFAGSGNIEGASFGGNIANSHGSGQFDGQFYGPAAEEVGGTFQAPTYDPDGGYIGSFGAQR